MKLLVIACVVVGCVCASLLGLTRIDRDHGMKFSMPVLAGVCVCSVIVVWIWSAMSVNMPRAIRGAWLILHIYFLCCSVTDHLTCQVYDIFQYVGVGAAAYLILAGSNDVMIGVSLLLFGAAQYFLFMKLYGKADGMTFLAAALAEGALGYEISGYLLHMIIAYLMLGAVQLFKGNIGRKGQLRTAVPFVPYITVSFWIMLVFAEEIRAGL